MTARTPRNVLYIMCDQLRRDYLSCYGHPHLHTPNIDRLAAEGVRFDRAYVQSTICGPSRMSAYTGRYVSSHQAGWNGVPLPVGELTLGDYLRPHQIRTALVGKTHAEPDFEGMARLGIDPDSERGRLLSNAGFEPYARHDGIYSDALPDKLAGSDYAHFLRERGHDYANPWHDVANSAQGPNGEILSGWRMRNARLPARVPVEESETVYTTDRALDFIREQGEQPWCLHLSYIKPHWPYIAPAPYHALYDEQHVVPAKRAAAGTESDHPVYQAFRQHQESVNFSRDEVRDTVIPTYMGLIKQIDDEIGRLLADLEQSGRLDDTLIIFTADHGDYLGDHYLGEKEFLLEQAVNVPFIVRDPSPAADATRGTVSTRLVEAIDVVPTALDLLGIEAPTHVLDGRSLRPLLHGLPVANWRVAAISEYDYGFQWPTRERLDRPVDGSRMYMVRTERWKAIWYDGFRPQLFDLENDPDEFVDLGASDAHSEVLQTHHQHLFDWLRGLRRQTTISHSEIDRRGKMFRYGEPDNVLGIEIGVW